MAQVERHSYIKRYVGHPLFVVASFDTWLRTYDHSHGRFDVTLDSGEVIEGGTLHDRLEDEPVHLPRAPRRCSSHPKRDSTLR